MYRFFDNQCLMIVLLIQEKFLTNFELLDFWSHFDYPSTTLMSYDDRVCRLKVVTTALLPQMDVCPTNAALWDGNQYFWKFKKVDLGFHFCNSNVTN